jgi:BTB/POZ domain-containing protein 9
MLSIRNVCLIYDTASLYSLPDLITACRTFMDKHAAEILSQGTNS